MTGTCCKSCDVGEFIVDLHQPYHRNILSGMTPRGWIAAAFLAVSLTALWAHSGAIASAAAASGAPAVQTATSRCPFKRLLNHLGIQERARMNP